MADVLESQRSATRFRVLVEIADRQPAVSQGEIADAVGITSQAVSEYVQDLADEGFVRKEGRSRYRVTTEGVDWLLSEASEVRRYLEYVTGDVLGNVREDAAIALSDIETGETVSLSLVDGLLHADPDVTGAATGTATRGAATGEDVGVTDFSGIIDLDPGEVVVLQVPAIGTGGSRNVDPEVLQEYCAGSDLVVAAGVEAVVALDQAGIEPATRFAAGEVAADAAGRGIDVTVVATTGLVSRITDPLTDAEVPYEIANPT